MAGSLLLPFVLGAMDANGDPVAGGKLNTYAAGTSTPLATYSDSALAVLNANPVILSAAGRATVYLTNAGYKLVLTDSADVVLWTQDNVRDLGQAAAVDVGFNVAKSISFDLDNGTGNTDDVMLAISSAITITAARIVYTEDTSGTVAGGSVSLGTTQGGGEIVAAANYQNGQSIGTRQALTLVSGAVAANTPIFVRHIGVAATQAGHAHVEIEF